MESEKPALAGQNNDKPKTELPNWDLFKNIPQEEAYIPVEEKPWYRRTIITLKILAYILTFGVVLGGAVFSKFGIVLMAGRLNANRLITVCNGAGNSTALPIPIPPEEKVYWTWLLFLAFAVPEFFVFFRSVRFCFFKGHKTPSWLEFGVPFIFEMLHTIGLALFVFCILPNLDSAKAVVLCSTIYLIPGVLSILTGFFTTGWSIYRGFDIAATVLQSTVVFMWVLFPEKSEQNMWLLPICIILMSLGFWTNYVDESSDFGFIQKLAKLQPDLLATNKGYFTYVWISLFKIGIFFAFMLVSLEMQGEMSINFFFENSGAAWNFQVNSTYTNVLGLPTQNSLNIWQSPLFLQIFAGLLCYIFSKYACKIGIQPVSFAAPLTLALPVTVLLILLLDPSDICFFNTPYFGTMEFISYTGNLFGKNHAYIWIFWWISQVWLTVHIWFPKSERLARTERLFVVPMYNGILVEQSIGLNRRREISEIDRRPPKYGENDSNTIIDPEEKDDIPRIYACATMWHENKEEMIEIMKSILRMDLDQFIRRAALDQYNFLEGYYEYETHIFFDDAFVLSDGKDYKSPQILNSFVKEFISIIDEAALHVHKNSVRIPPPLKYLTPYGGRLEWTLPGHTKMICHLKDKSKIRHKKRWSQCMYMYYLLGYKLMDNEKLTEKSKEIRARNTFILALDGDVDFQPIAVERLVDLMRKNHKLGAACGRIHPTGSTGLMIWYQKFEYATGHWLQKATEHMIGCVLCSPGCFSLFRGQALMSDNVMAKYTTVSEEPLHHVQYDQGEDRWLCTLILQQGYRVDYAAASDAYTHAPEEFDEFYNQRRRWVPSTTANIMDLLTDFRRTIRVNSDISLLYILYQFALMFGTIMGPGTIFLMIVGAVNTIFGVDKWTSFLINLVPILFYSLICYFAKSKTQLLVAKIFSVAYALLMLAVLVGIAVLVSEEGLLSPSAIFLVIVASSFIISAIMHPLEFDCLIHGFVYFITIPSMYLLLIIYSIFNLNNVSWGTREVPKVKTKEELMAEEKEAAEMKLKQDKYGLFSFLREGKNDSEGSLEFSFAGLFKLMCCTHKNQDASRIATSLEHMTNRLEAMEKKLGTLDGPGPGESSTENISSKRRSYQRNGGGGNNIVGSVRMPTLDENSENTSSGDMSDIDLSKIQFEDMEPKAKDDKPDDFWIKNAKDILITRKIDNLSEHETEFWNNLIVRYLKPIEADKAKEKKMAEALMQLRNKCVFVFFMLNAMFVLLIWFLELKKKNLNVKWPFGNKELELEPIGFLFVAFFAVILVVQFIAMLFHRFATFSHILASTSIHLPIPWFKTNSVESHKKEFAKDAIKLLKQVFQEEELDENENIIEDKPGFERNTVSNLYRNTRDTRAMVPLEERLEKKLDRLSTLDPKRQTQFLKSTSIANKKDNIVDTLRQRRSQIISMRKASASSMYVAPGTSGAGDPAGFQHPPPVNYNTRPLISQNTITIPTINEPRGGIENRGFTTSSDEEHDHSHSSSSSDGEEC